MPIYDGNALRPGQKSTGPALVEERNTTILIGPDDRLEVDASDNFLIQVAASGSGVMMDDPIGLALVQKQLDHIARQMGWVMMRTARSPIFSQSHDFSCFIGDAHGNVVSQADGLADPHRRRPIRHQGRARGFAGEIAEGDVYILSDPYEAGGNHLPDWTIIRPVFVRRQSCSHSAATAPINPISAAARPAPTMPPRPRSSTKASACRCCVWSTAASCAQDLWRLLLLNSRCPDLLDGDLRAMVGSTRDRRDAGRAKRLATLPGENGAEYLEGILDHAERLMRDEVTQLAPGVYEGEDESDNDCFGPADIRVRVAHHGVRAEALQVDFTGSSPQIRGFKNSSLANTHSSVYLAVLAFLGATLPKNDGAFRPITILAPEGTIVNARPPAPMTMNTVYPATNIVHACWKALRACDPARALRRLGQGAALRHVRSHAESGTFVMYHWHGLPAAGAVHGRDGFPTMGTVPTLCGLRLANVEAYEQLYPVRIHKYEMRCDADGAGEFRGGTGIDYVADVDVAADYSFRSEGAYGLTAFGVNGGQSGKTGSLSLAAMDGTSD